MFRYLFLLLLLGIPTTGSAEIINRAVAIVNNDIITAHQFENALASRREAGEPLDPATRRDVLNKMIEERLLQQRIDQLQLTAAPEEIEAAIDDILKKNQLTLPQLKAALVQQGIDFDDYRESLKKQLLRFKLMGREVQAKVEVTKREIRRYYEEHQDDYLLPPQVRIEHLSLRGDDRLLMARARTRLDSGEPLEKVLAEFASDERVFGGEMGSFAPGELAPAFAAAIDGLPVGGVSQIVARDDMLHLLIVAEKLPGRVKPLDEQLSARIEAQLREEEAQERFADWTTNLRKNAHIIIHLDEEEQDSASSED